MLARSCPFTAVILVSASLLQLTLALSVESFSLGFLFKLFFLGTPLAHTLFVCNRECSSGLVFGHRKRDRFAGMLSNLVGLVPWAEPLRIFEHEHQAFYQNPSLDPFFMTAYEKSLQNSPSHRISYLLLFPILFLGKVMRRRGRWRTTDYFAAHATYQTIFNFGLYYVIGWAPFLFLTLSTYLALCPLFPLSADLLLSTTGYSGSYHGVWNIFSLNAGLIQEKRLDAKVPWIYRPLLETTNTSDKQLDLLEFLHSYVMGPVRS